MPIQKCDKMGQYLTDMATSYRIEDYTVTVQTLGQIITLAPANPNRVAIYITSSQFLGTEGIGIRSPSGGFIPFVNQSQPFCLNRYTIWQDGPLPQQEWVYTSSVNFQIWAMGLVRG